MELEAARDKVVEAAEDWARMMKAAGLTEATRLEAKWRLLVAVETWRERRARLGDPVRGR